MIIRPLTAEEPSPMNLLLLADPSEKIVREYLELGKCFVGEYEGEVVGVYVLLPTRPETVELVNVAVARDHQSKGFGAQLVKHAIETAKVDNYKRMEIGTGNSSIGQLALYQKCGFRITGIDRDFYLRHYDQEIFEDGIQCCDMIRLSQNL
ncbi:GNAT family N-acetyltransferase [Priestia koreensis]|uniref:Acetyltransferase n=1 Tax=Priestia koreensis TaxID=284581 RepID=A0A0M0L4Y7_9BACI|nr:GNAT family N-acetyltransferase [Priestia koreensis]KOO46099.1 acetyltransferase [Priestia koreensis]MCM3004117.1 GNAT family N-acetyltransferase [Priestia koreensis]UNL83336.1 GNAT family N-acetyltransferase [Priestia koreensis]